MIRQSSAARYGTGGNLWLKVISRCPFLFSEVRSGAVREVQTRTQWSSADLKRKRLERRSQRTSAACRTAEVSRNSARHNGNFAGKSAQWVLLPRSSNGSSERSRLQSAQLLSLRPSTPYIDVGIIPATPDWNDSPSTQRALEQRLRWHALV